MSILSFKNFWHSWAFKNSCLFFCVYPYCGFVVNLEHMQKHLFQKHYVNHLHFISIRICKHFLYDIFWNVFLWWLLPQWALASYLRVGDAPLDHVDTLFLPKINKLYYNYIKLYLYIFANLICNIYIYRKPKHVMHKNC